MERVYISSHLRKKQEFFSHFTGILKSNEIEPAELEYTKDIWCRDFMTVKSSDGKYLLFDYDPSYLKGKFAMKKTPRADIITMLNKLGVGFTDIPEIKLDGGNVVRDRKSVV